MHALARVRLLIARFATGSMVLAVVATLGGTVVLLSYGLPAATRRGAAPAVATPDLENAAAPAARAEQHARLSTVPVDSIERVQQQLTAFVSSGQLPEVSLAEIPDLGFAIDDSTFEGDALKSLTEVTGDLDEAEPQLAHLGPSLTSLVGGGGGGFGGGGGAGSAGVAGSSASEGDDANEQSIQSIEEPPGRGESASGGTTNGGSASSGSSGNSGSGSASSGSAGNGSASNGSATNGRAGGVSTPTTTTSTPRGGAPTGGPSEGAPGRVGGGSVGTVVSVPEPSSMLLIGLGLVGAAATRRRKSAR